jgi:hypothetical protein
MANSLAPKNLVDKLNEERDILKRARQKYRNARSRYRLAKRRAANG